MNLLRIASPPVIGRSHEPRVANTRRCAQPINQSTNQPINQPLKADMKTHSIRKALVVALLSAAASSAALAAEPAPAGAMPGMSDMSKHHPMAKGSKGAEGGMSGMHGMGDMAGMGDMMGMMKMMSSCQTMMDGAKAPASALMPKLPPGNEKLEFQMRAEMMQKMGQIAAQYADKIKETR